MQDTDGVTLRQLGETGPLPARLRRTVELVYSVEGVVGARIWHWDGRIAIGIRVAARVSASTAIHRVETAVAGIREAGELWDFGILTDSTS